MAKIEIDLPKVHHDYLAKPLKAHPWLGPSLEEFVLYCVREKQLDLAGVGIEA